MAEKIGILTFHCAHNYGAVLQAYATQELLKGVGYDVEVIDYRPDYLVRPYKRFDISRFRGKNLIHTIRHIVSEILLVPIRMLKYKRFETFISTRLQLSDGVLPEKYDIIIIGSDQVWNKRQTGGEYDPMYFADFNFAKQHRRYIADAASMETGPLSVRDSRFLSEGLRNFNSISVREQDLVNILKERLNVEAVQIQDPVVQVNPTIWNKLARPTDRKKPYVLVYKIRDDRTIDSFVARLAKERGLEVVEVSAFPDGKKLFKASQAVAVEDFLGLIAGASCVVTTSFHATVFSVIFRRPFYCFDFNLGVDSRQRSFLKSVGLEDRMLPLGCDVPAEVECDFSAATQLLDSERKKSSDFMLNSISGDYGQE